MAHHVQDNMPSSAATGNEYTSSFCYYVIYCMMFIGNVIVNHLYMVQAGMYVATYICIVTYYSVMQYCT